MWVFTSKGFLSAVQHRANKDRVMIRARRKEHLEATICKEVNEQVFETEYADYRFRITVSKVEFSDFLVGQVKAIDYDNFKNSIPESENQYHDACLKVWGALYATQDGTELYEQADDEDWYMQEEIELETEEDEQWQ